ncbi:type VI secretion system baseplate subunit TssG [Budvicia aquatica]|uniref:type VI secretion system baseplate subunit TssG n=1 Tax=Budvicia aquatica TaxID=82979 RepID=UPI002088AD90|nr:type VI secretion system baseplate subunit TssG [Budvicia aquatica]GKX52685.1 type VI secretion protein [Budvicia aquatica]
MASEHRSALADITPGQYSFYQLLELIHKDSGKQDNLDKDILPEDEIIRFKSSGSLAFPSSDLSSLKMDEQGRYQLEVAFLGLQGSQSPLPGFYLEPLAWEYAQEEQSLATFLDLFNHRSTQLLHRIWRKYRYYISFKNNGNDAFSQRMFALVGLENPAIRQALTTNHSKMLAYAGLLSGSSRSPDIISGVIAHCFDLADVTVLPWQFRQVDIPEDQQTVLGEKNSILGDNFVLGDYVHDCSGKFTLCLNNLTIKRYLSFLPTGDAYLPLKTFVSFILRDQFAFDISLSLAADQLTEMDLGNDVTCLLGWTTFIGEMPENPNVTLCVRE